jgi:peptide/nickel transport system substrate-binding protein
MTVRSVRPLVFAGLLSGLVATGPAAHAQAMTDVGTPRAETLIVEHLNGRIGNPAQMNFYQEGLQTGEGLRQIAYSQLWDIDTSTGKQFPALASTMPEPLNAEFTRFRFGIRQGMAWSDGVPFTARDVVFTMNMILGNAKIPYNAYLSTVIKSMTAPSSWRPPGRIRG